MPAVSKFTGPVKEAILQVKRVGGPDTLACAHAGIGVSTLERWLSKGRDEDQGRYHDFAVEYEVAKAHPQLRALTLLQTKMEDNPSLLMKYIERQVDGYAPPQPVQVAGPQQATVIQLAFADGPPPRPGMGVVIDAEESPALGDGGDRAQGAAP